MANLLKFITVFVVIAACSNAGAGQTEPDSTTSSSNIRNSFRLSWPNNPRFPNVLWEIVKLFRLPFDFTCVQQIWSTIQRDCEKQWIKTPCYLEHQFQTSKRDMLREEYSQCMGARNAPPSTEPPPTWEEVQQAFNELVSSLDKEDGGQLSTNCVDKLNTTIEEKCNGTEDTTCWMHQLKTDPSVSELKKAARNCRENEIDKHLTDELSNVITGELPDVCKEQAITMARKFCAGESGALSCENTVMDNYNERKQLVNDSAVCYFNEHIKDSPFTPLNVEATFDSTDAGLSTQTDAVMDKMGTGDSIDIFNGILDLLEERCPTNRRLRHTCEAREMNNVTTLTELSLAGWLESVNENNRRIGPDPPTTEGTTTTTTTVPLGNPIATEVPEFKTTQELFDYLNSKLGTDVTSGCSQEESDAVKDVCPDESTRDTCVADTLKNKDTISKLISPVATCYYTNAVSKEPLTKFDMDYTDATIEDAISDGVLILTEEMSDRLHVPRTQTMRTIGLDVVEERCTTGTPNEQNQCAYDTLQDLQQATDVGQELWTRYLKDIATGTEE